ncbi:MAG: hypothetical protein AAFU03_09790, partial [Bacteroidota bacterium]
DGSNRWVDDRMLSVLVDPIPQYWLQVPGGQLKPVPRAGFKREMRAYFENMAPALASKVGRKGYRYRNLIAIVQEFNNSARKDLRRL